MRILLLALALVVASCAGSPPPPEATVVRDLGRHPLPFQPNERFILQSVHEDPGLWMSSPISIVYYLDGRRREWTLAGEASSDGFVTDMGRLLASEIEGVESPIMDERVIRLATDEEITVSGNTINAGGIRLRKIEPVEQGTVE